MRISRGFPQTKEGHFRIDSPLPAKERERFKEIHLWRRSPTLHVVCSLIPEIHFTLAPTRNAISAILNGHRIIVQGPLVKHLEDVERPQAVPLPLLVHPCLLTYLRFHGSDHYVTRQPKGRPKSQNMVTVLISDTMCGSQQLRARMLSVCRSFSNWRPVRAPVAFALPRLLAATLPVTKQPRAASPPKPTRSSRYSRYERSNSIRWKIWQKKI